MRVGSGCLKKRLRLQAFYDLTENLVFDYVNFLHQAAELVELNPLVASPIRDVNDIIVMQTAIIGEADILCTKDSDFFEDPAREYLSKLWNCRPRRHLSDSSLALLTINFSPETRASASCASVTSTFMDRTRNGWWQAGSESSLTGFGITLRTIKGSR